MNENDARPIKIKPITVRPMMYEPTVENSGAEHFAEQLAETSPPIGIPPKMVARGIEM